MGKIITDLKNQKRDTQRVNVYLDGEFAFGLAYRLASSLNVGDKLGSEDIKLLTYQDAIEKAYMKALNFINYRPRSASEVERSLRKREIPDNIIKKVIERLENKGYINDLEFAHFWVDNRSSFRPRGIHALRIELRKKGIADNIIDEALEPIDEEEMCALAAKKQAHKYKNLDWLQFRKKLTGYLARRGFQYAIISDIIPKIWKDQVVNLIDNDNN
jgi:regulatory protein